MIVKMLCSSAGPTHGLLANVIYDLEPSLAKRLLNAKSAAGTPVAELVSDPRERAKARKMERAVQGPADPSSLEDE